MTPEISLELAGLTRDSLRGEVAVVTGAGQGIGRAVARALAQLGAAVVVAEIAPSGAEVEAELRAAGAPARFVHTDVADEVSVGALAASVVAEFGAPTLLINNAIAIVAASVLDLPVADWDRMLAVNLRGTFLMCRAVLPHMIARRRGTIINMVSTEAMPGLSAYIASKQGIAGFTQSLAAEVAGSGVAVVAFGPGMVVTPGLQSVAGSLAPRLGLSPEQFLSMSLHAAYEGPMPAEHAAVATACLAARLAPEYHGEVTNAYAILERIGLLADPPAPAAAPPSPTLALDRPALVTQALDLADQLHGALLETESEFERLPVFVRPMARGGFRSRVGVAPLDARRAVDKLTEHLRRLQATHSGADAEFAVDRERLSAMLGRLAAYYAGVPRQTARFTRDAAWLESLEAQMARRIAVIRQLDEALARLGG